MRRLAIVLTLLAAGCTQTMNYPGVRSFTGATPLGPVEACRGSGCCDGKPASWGCDWPLALNAPPSAFDVQHQLIGNAAQRYGVPQDEIAIDTIKVEMTTEVNGTVRGWTARANAARAPGE